MRDASLSRRDLLRLTGLLGTSASLPAPSAEAAQRRPGPAPDVYRSIGVRPLINARGTFTIISGSLMLPEVRSAMDAAARHYVHLDELAEAIGARLATLTGAEWGLVTSGCSAGLTHATAACVAGGNPDLYVRMPNLNGFEKDEVIIPKHSRNVYDAAVRVVGVRVVEVNSVAELEAALGPRTAAIYVLAGQSADQSVLNLKAIAQIANPKGVPILVDAAAEILDDSQRASSERRGACGLQRRQMPARTPNRRPAAGAQKPYSCRLGSQRATSRSRPCHESGQGRSHGHARRRRDVGQTGS